MPTGNRDGQKADMKQHVLDELTENRSKPRMKTRVSSIHWCGCSQPNRKWSSRVREPFVTRRLGLEVWNIEYKDINVTSSYPEKRQLEWVMPCKITPIRSKLRIAWSAPSGTRKRWSRRVSWCTSWHTQTNTNEMSAKFSNGYPGNRTSMPLPSAESHMWCCAMNS